jgi:hypothetical protein
VAKTKWAGKRVLVRQCLVDKPRRLRARRWSYGGLSDTISREECGAVGEVTHWHQRGIVAVRFEVDSMLLPGETLQTMLFAHIDDIEKTDEPMSWPLVEGAEII